MVDARFDAVSGGVHERQIHMGHEERGHLLVLHEATPVQDHGERLAGRRALADRFIEHVRVESASLAKQIGEVRHGRARHALMVSRWRDLVVIRVS